MRKFNYIYLLLIPLAYLLYQLTINIGGETAFFYGFAENKETELSHSEDILIKEIKIKPGQLVEEGEVLMIVGRAEIAFQKEIKSSDLQQIAADKNIESQKISIELRQIDAEEEAKMKHLDAEIKILKSKIASKLSIFDDLKHVDEIQLEEVAKVEKLQLKVLEESRVIERKSFESKRKVVRDKLALVGKTDLPEIARIKKQISFIEEAEDQLTITAPSDGIIGNVQVKVGENISSFNTLISFYEKHPSVVKGYVHESMILQVNVGDSLKVSSTNRPDNIIEGFVSGLGSRIIEIPERLRKVPEQKTYGREVIISIPSQNDFLQKEKVLLNTNNLSPKNNGFFVNNKPSVEANEKELEKTINIIQ